MKIDEFLINFHFRFDQCVQKQFFFSDFTTFVICRVWLGSEAIGCVYVRFIDCLNRDSLLYFVAVNDYRLFGKDTDFNEKWNLFDGLWHRYFIRGWLSARERGKMSWKNSAIPTHAHICCETNSIMLKAIDQHAKALWSSIIYLFRRKKVYL